MESYSDPAGTLAAAEQSRRILADVRLPSGYEASIGAAIAVQIATTAVGSTSDPAWGAWIVLLGLLAFAAVAAIQLVRFRNLNDVWLGGFASKVVLGMAPLTSLVYTGALFGAVLAAFHDLWWAVALAALSGTAGYVLGGRRWLARYRQDPVANAHGETIAWLLGTTAVVVAGAKLLVLNNG